MKDQVPESVKSRRLNEVNRLQTEIAKDINGKLIGRRYRVLVDGRALKGNLLQGRNPADKVILFEGAESVIGAFADVEVTAADSWSLKGRIL